MTNPKRKLTDEQVSEIKRLGALRRESHPKVLAERFGIHRNTVTDIWRGKIYRSHE